MGVVTVEVLTADEAAERRSQILRSVGGDEATLRAHAAMYALDARELAALDDLDALDYLLGQRS